MKRYVNAGKFLSKVLKGFGFVVVAIITLVGLFSEELSLGRAILADIIVSIICFGSAFLCKKGMSDYLWDTETGEVFDPKEQPSLFLKKKK